MSDNDKQWKLWAKRPSGEHLIIKQGGCEEILHALKTIPRLDIELWAMSPDGKKVLPEEADQALYDECHLSWDEMKYTEFVTGVATSDISQMQSYGFLDVNTIKTRMAKCNHTQKFAIAEQCFTMAYRLMIALAKRHLAEDDDREGQSWEGLSGTSKASYKQKARDEAFVDHCEFRSMFEHFDVEEVDDELNELIKRKRDQDATE